MIRSRALPLSLFLIVASFMLLTFSNVQAQNQIIRNVYDTKTNTWVQVTALFGKLPSYGYIPIRVEIRNGTEIDRELNLDFVSRDQASFGSETGSQMSSSFQCSCAAGQRETYDFIVPLTTIFQTSSYGTDSELNMNLRCSGFAPITASMSSNTDYTWPAILASKALYTPNASSISSLVNRTSGTSSEFAGSFEPKSMPTDWRGYMGQEIIMLTSNDWSELDPGARTAILDWNRLGGRLLIYTSSTSDTFASLQIDGAETAKGAKTINRSIGTVSLLPLPSSGILQAKKTHSMLMAGSTGDASSPTNYYGLLHDFSNRWPLQKILGQKHFNITLFILILLAFGILIGPINLFVFAKSGKRHKLFITTPIISLGASALLIVLILFQDGFGGRGHRVVLMDIQAEENKAYIIQEQVARTGVLLGSSFETSEPAMMTPVALSPSRWSRVVTDGNAPASYESNDGEEGIKASGDWFQSRSIHGHLLKTVRPTRGRIELAPRAGAPVLTSTFNYDLETIYYHAHDGSWWKAPALAKGNSVTLVPSSAGDFQKWLSSQASLFSSTNKKRIKDFSSQAGRFYTLTENASATETYRSIKWLSTKTLITGQISK